MHNVRSATLQFFLFLVLTKLIAPKPYYCTPQYDNSSHDDIDGCWPSEETWDSFVNEMGIADYDGRPKVRKIQADMYNVCLAAGTDAFKILESADGMCMQTHNCNSEFCESDNDLNLPAYTVLVEDVSDIQQALQFANYHDIAVSIKTSGHSYSGSSTQKDSLLIWMAHFLTPQDDELFYKAGVNVTSLNLCNISDEFDILKIGGGEVWGQVYDKAANFGNDLVGGGGLSVSAAGGWLQGGGLSALSRSYGLGIDNVVRIEAVLSNSTIIIADECSNSDLFWALRGGGGGTYAIVTAAYIKMHNAVTTTKLDMFFILAGVETESCYDSSPDCILAEYYGVCSTYFNLCPVSCMVGCSGGKIDYQAFEDTLSSFIDFWVDTSLTLDPRWGGYWTGTSLNLFFLGNKEEAETTLRNNVTNWIASLPELQGKRVYLDDINEFPSYWEARGRNSSTDATGSYELNLASRHIPHNWVSENKEKAKDLLYDLVMSPKGSIVTSYILGGAIMDVGEGSTSVNPSIRTALWSLHTYAYEKSDDSYHQTVRDIVGNDISGSCYNHGSYKEPEWELAFWGSSLDSLRKIALKYDTEKRFNCWHCIGYVDPLSEEPAPPPIPPPSPTTFPSIGPNESRSDACNLACKGAPCFAILLLSFLLL